MFLMCRITESKRQQNEINKQKITERELTNLNQKINKLLTKLEEHDQEVATTMEEECVICITSKATISTFPCGHTVICRRCFVKTIQNSVQQKSLPLRCVICREKILRLKQSFTGDPLPGPNHKYKRQSVVYQPYANRKKKSTFSCTSTSTCKKKIARQVINNLKNDQANNKVDLDNEVEYHSNYLTTYKKTDGELTNYKKSWKGKNEYHRHNNYEEIKNDTNDNVMNEMNTNQIKMTEEQSSNKLINKSSVHSTRIKKLKQLTEQKPLNATLKAKLTNYFTKSVEDVNNGKKEKINYSMIKKVKKNWISRFKNKLINYSSEFKILLKF